MGIEAPILDGEEGIGQMGRHLLERNDAAAHLAAGREKVAVGGVDLDRRRPLGNFQGLDRRQMQRHPDEQATTASAAQIASTAVQ